MKLFYSVWSYLENILYCIKHYTITDLIWNDEIKK